MSSIAGHQTLLLRRSRPCDGAAPAKMPVRCGVTTVALVHGLFGAFGDERTWSRLAPHRVVVPDLLGYGEHADTPALVSLKAQVEHLRELLGDEPVHVVGTPSAG